MENIAQESLPGINGYSIQPSQYDELVSSLEIKLLKYEELKCTLTEIAKEIGLKDMPKLLNEDDKILVDFDETLSLLRVGDIKYIRTNGKGFNIFISDNKKAAVAKSIANWETLLPSDLFIRINRFVIINLKFVEKISKCSNGTYKVKMSNMSAPITISRKYVADIKSNK